MAKLFSVEGGVLRNPYGVSPQFGGTFTQEELEVWIGTPTPTFEPIGTGDVLVYDGEAKGKGKPFNAGASALIAEKLPVEGDYVAGEAILATEAELGDLYDPAEDDLEE